MDGLCLFSFLSLLIIIYLQYVVLICFCGTPRGSKRVSIRTDRSNDSSEASGSCGGDDDIWRDIPDFGIPGEMMLSYD